MLTPHRGALLSYSAIFLLSSMVRTQLLFVMKIECEKKPFDFYIYEFVKMHPPLFPVEKSDL